MLKSNPISIPFKFKENDGLISPNPSSSIYFDKSSIASFFLYPIGTLKPNVVLISLKVASRAAFQLFFESKLISTEILTLPFPPILCL